jgi:hypothetical protein
MASWGADACGSGSRAVDSFNLFLGNRVLVVASKATQLFFGASQLDISWLKIDDFCISKAGPFGSEPFILHQQPFWRICHGGERSNLMGVQGEGRDTVFAKSFPWNDHSIPKQFVSPHSQPPAVRGANPKNPWAYPMIDDWSFGFWGGIQMCPTWWLLVASVAMAYSRRETLAAPLMYHLYKIYKHDIL